MSAPVKLEKAQLRQLDATFTNEINQGNRVTLQFNPESLKVSFANQLQTPSAAGTTPTPEDKSGTPARQFVGAGTTKLALVVYFDVNRPVEGQATVSDVRELTKKVAFFITPKKEGNDYLPPAVRFVWGSFQFDGLMDSLEESLEFFSSEGKPLRASLSLSLSQQRITEFSFGETSGLAGPGGLGNMPGTRPLTEALAGSTLQGLASQAGLGDKWQTIAAANGIENPRRLEPGQLINLNPLINPLG